MKILLLLPKYNTYLVTPPLGLGYLASSLREAGHDVAIEDCILTGRSPPRVLSEHTPDIVAVSAMTPYYMSALSYIKEARSRGLITILGGNHITALARDTMKQSCADYGVIGEGEKTAVELMGCIEKEKSIEKVKGIAYKNKINPGRELINNLDEIPFPAWDLMKPENYPQAYHGAAAKRNPVAPITSSRGCPFNCYFCSSIGMWNRSIRFRNPKNVVDEIEMLVTDYGVKEFHFEDDNMTLNKKHTTGICDEILERKLDITWACPNGVRIDTMDRELLMKMKKAGCHMLTFGIESGSQKILDAMNKNLNLGIVKDTIELIRDVGIKTTGFFIIGLPGDTKETIEQTIEFSKKVPFDRAHFGTFTPLPGSKAFEDWVKGRDKNKINWNEFDMFHFISTGKMKKKELIAFQKRAFREFYTRPKTVYNMLSNTNVDQLKWLIKRSLAYYKR
jgi:radical SAM superfamily enzyme YgiQ (UPF0313 family)